MANEVQAAARYDLESIRKMPTDQLKRELADALKISADALVYMAAIWKELEGRGVDLSDLRTGLATYLPAIAAGRLDPQAVVYFAGKRTVLSALASLPIEDQRRLADGGSVPFVRLLPSGEAITEQKGPLKIKSVDLYQVFDSRVGRIKSEAEQEALLRKRLLGVGRKKPSIQPDPAKQQVHIDGVILGRRDLLDALSKLSQPRLANRERTVELPLKLSPEEIKAIQAKAGGSGKDVQALLLSALDMAGVFDALED